MHDIKAIRENFDAFATAIARRPLSDEQRRQVAQLLDLDTKARALQTQRQDAEAGRNAASKQIGAAKAQKNEAEASRLMEEVARLKGVMETVGAQEAGVAGELRAILERLPNVPAADVPEGADETGNEEVRQWSPGTASLEARFVGGPEGPRPNDVKDHVALGETLGMMDFEAAARMSGARFVVLKGHLARLERALAAFMLDLQTQEHGYQETSPPYLVKDHAVYGTGQLPKFEEDLFRVGASPGSLLRDFEDWTSKSADAYVRDVFEDEDEDEVDNNEWNSLFRAHKEHLHSEAGIKRFLASSADASHWLIPTAEVSLTNIFRETILDEKDLATPIRMTADTPCFRSEAGSAGRDTRGMIRMHQFRKVELVSICKPEESKAEHDRMTACAEEVLKRLELPFRTMLLCAGDMGFGAQKTFDLEVWLPSQNTYREISSCSNCGDFQARRMDGRFRREGAKGTEYFHTLNGSGLAVGRTLVAVLENYQNEDGSIAVPRALQPYMGGLDRIARA